MGNILMFYRMNVGMREDFVIFLISLDKLS